MAKTKFLASVCLAITVLGTQAIAEDTGVDSVVPSQKQEANVLVEEDILTEQDQVELIQKAIQEVEMRLLEKEQQSAVAGQDDTDATSAPMQTEESAVVSGEQNGSISGYETQDAVEPQYMPAAPAVEAADNAAPAVQSSESVANIDEPQVSDASVSQSDDASSAPSVSTSNLLGTTEPAPAQEAEQSAALEKVVPTMQYESDSQMAEQTAPQTEEQTGDEPVFGASTEEAASSVPSAPMFADESFSLDEVVEYEPGFVQEFPNGEINWYTGVIKAKGESVASGLDVSRQQAQLRTTRAATIAARKNLMEILSKIPVTEKMRVRTILSKDEDIMQFVRGDMQNSQIIGSEFNEDGIATVTVSITLRDLFLEKLLGSYVSFRRVSENPYAASNAVAEAILHQAEGAEETPAPALNITYTGLLIDAREVGLNPALTVSILDEAGNVLYSPKVVSRTVALKEGMADYAASYEEALTSKRSSTNPLVLKAVAAKGRMRSDIVISDQQAQLLLQIDETHKFLQNGRVVIVCQ